MNLSNPEVRELLQYASNNNYCVELGTHYAVVDGFHGNQVIVVDNYPYPLIYAGAVSEECLILPAEFKRLFAKR
ncbi:TPA: hypothetical protein N2E47_002178 [Salmonella enterica]|nr:hypothetical protein [Salmonella enterica]